MADYDNFEFIYKKAPTVDAMYYYLDKILKPKYNSYSLFYLPTHSSPGSLGINKTETIDIQEFAERFEGRFTDKIIHFGGCSFFNIDTFELQNIKKRLGAKLISGFSKDVYPIDAIAFEILLFSTIQKYKSKLGYLKQRMYTEQPYLAKKLGFDVI